MQICTLFSYQFSLEYLLLKFLNDYHIELNDLLTEWHLISNTYINLKNNDIDKTILIWMHSKWDCNAFQERRR